VFATAQPESGGDFARGRKSMNASKKSNSSPRPKRKPKPFARWSFCGDRIFYDSKEIAHTRASAAQAVFVLNDLGVTLKGTP
jgi:hypothetical protein